MSAVIYGNVLNALVLLALSAVIVPFFARYRKPAGWINLVFTSAAAVILLNVSYTLIFNDRDSLFNLGIFSLTPLVDAVDMALVLGSCKLYLLVDSFSAFFMAIISFMAVISALYSIQYMEHYPEYSLKSYYINFPLFILGMIALVTVDDLSIGFTIAWQLMTVSSYFLVKFEYKKKENVRSANKYLVLMELAWLLIVGSTFLIDGIGIGDSLHEITGKLGASSGTTIYIVYGLILVGFGFKAGIFPLGQLWLPDAHSIAPSPISALLSGVMLKTGIYGIIRTFYWMVPHDGSHYNGFLWGTVIAAIGVVTLFIGTVQSMKQNDTKRLLAYSSIGQIGYIVFAIGAALLMFNSDSEFARLMALIAIVGAVYHIINHAVFKGLLFLTSGSVLYATGTKNMNALGGLLKLMPVSGVIAAIASLSIAGVPPLNGFASKWTIISTSILAGSEMLFLAIFGIIALFTSAITLACYVKFFGMTFAASGTEWTIKKDIKEVSGIMLAPKLILTLLCIVQGIIPWFYFSTIIGIFTGADGSIVQEAFRNFNVAAHMDAPLMGVSINGLSGITTSVAVPVVMIIVFAFTFALAYAFRKSLGAPERTADTWLCGYQDLHDGSRYKDSSMFSSLKSYMWWTGGNVKKKL